MDFSAILQMRSKRFWWIDVVFYFVISLLIASVLCYFIFFLKNMMQRSEIEETVKAMESVGTVQQKEYEKTVINYQKKISDFKKIFLNHEFASNVFVFMQDQTMPNIWFKRFGLERRSNRVQLFGQADNTEAFSRQVAHFEKNEYVKDVATLNSTVGDLAKIQFNLHIDLDSKIFGYILRPKREETIIEFEEDDEEEKILDDQKEITIFNLLTPSEVVGTIDQQNHTVFLEVPYGTDITKLHPLIIASSRAVVSPPSGISQNFSTPLVYRVTAEDGSFQNYTVTVNVLEAPEESLAQKTKEKRAFWIILIFILIFVAVASVAFSVFWLKFKNKKQF
jgi:flagellar basal body-associated protein FliL